MTPEVITVGLFLLNGVLGLSMWLLKTAYTDLKEKVKAHDEEFKHVKEHYFKKEDFREFKEELWRRFDKLENRIEERVNK